MENKYKGVYIRNIEAVDAYKMTKGEKLNKDGELTKLTNDWSGYIPYSLELLKLKNVGMQLINNKRVKIDGKISYTTVSDNLKDKDFISGNNNKSLDLINVNFNCGYKNIDKCMEDEEYKELNSKLQEFKIKRNELNKKIIPLKNKIKKLNSKNESISENDVKTLSELENNKITIVLEIEKIKNDMEKILNRKYKMNKTELRNYLYTNGFADENGIEFVLYKRSGSKSRQGKVMFIRKEMADTMLSWSKMGIKFPDEEEFDIVGLAAYSSLVSSSIEDIININPDNILMVRDINSTWLSKNAKLICKGEDGNLVVEEDNENGIELKSSPTDGSSLLDISYFVEGIDFKLLRNHMFKSCAFRCDIQLFFRDYCEENNINYNNFVLNDMFGNKILAKNVKLICTPSSLKALKYSKYISNGTEKDMFSYWKEVVKSDCNIFGVCKTNKQSKWQFDGVSYQQMSYQMINSLHLTEEEIIELTFWECDYVEKLKNDIETFKKYLLLNSNFLNCNEAMVAILEKSPKFENTELFREFRTKKISKYKDKLKSGKIKNIGDYCTMFSNPLCYLKQAVGKYDENNLELQGNEVYTKLFDTNKELIMFRNPHTSQANVYIGRNVKVEAIDKYFGFGKNIIVVNSIRNEICQIMSGCDWDSDSCIVYDKEILLQSAEKCYGKYKVCENGIPKDSNKYKLTNESLAKIDDELSRSQVTIGRIVNLGQLAMSKYYDAKSNGANDAELEELQQIIDIMTILSGIAIDNAKKKYDIDLDEEIEIIEKRLNTSNKKPLFWRYVSQDKQLKTEEGREKRLRKYNTAMDILGEVIDAKIKVAEYKKNEDLRNLLVDNLDKNNANRKQQEEIIELVKELDKYIDHKMENKIKENEKDTYREIDCKIQEFDEFLIRKNIKAETILGLMLLIAGEGQKEKVEKIGNIGNRLIALLYRKSPKTFLSIFR